jgi:hypothetical protein
MSQRQNVRQLATQRARLRIYDPPPLEPRSACWRIDGYPARILIWSIEEWERLEDQPPDAQFHPFGVWCALRLD